MYSQGITKGKNREGQAHARLLFECLFVSFFLCYAQIRESRVLILPTLLLFLIVVIASCRKEAVLCTLLYFLPWSPLLKMQSGGTSFFTIALGIVCLYYLVKDKFLLELYQLILPAVLLALTMVAKGLQGNSFSKSYLLFFLMLFLFPCVAKDAVKNDFYLLTVFFTLGIITAALTAQKAAGYGNISQYINVASYLDITRLSGYYGDANFYCAQITACLSGTMLGLVKEEKAAKRALLAALSFLLLYCGLLSASKSFIVVGAAEFFVWILLSMERRNRGSVKVRILAGILLTAAVVLSSSAFQTLLAMVNERFSFASDLSGLTTGRTDVWANYCKVLSYHPKLLLLGEGFSNVTLDVLYNKASHNSIIQGIYQFGLLGFFVLLWWMRDLFREMRAFVKGKEDWKAVLLLCAGTVLPWMGLDILFFDELFLFPAFIMSGILYFSDRKEEA